MPKTLERLQRSMRHLEQASEADHTELALAAAKRVQRESRMLVRELAIKRDTATVREDTSA